VLTLTSQSCNESTRLITFVVSRVDSRIVTIRDRTNQEHMNTVHESRSQKHMNTVHESRSQKHMNTVHEHGSQNPVRYPTRKLFRVATPYKGIVRLKGYKGIVQGVLTPTA